MARWVGWALAASGAAGVRQPAVLFPAPPHLRPGPAHAAVGDGGGALVLRNAVLEAGWALEGPAEQRRLRPGALRGQHDGATVSLPQDAFYARTSGARLLRSSSLCAASDFNLTRLHPDANSPSAGLAYAGWRAEVRLVDPAGEIAATWAVELRDGANYLREFVELSSLKEAVGLRELVLLDASAPESSTSGRVRGSVCTAGSLFMGYEHPQAINGDGSLPEQDGSEVLMRFVPGERRGEMSIDVDITTLVLPGHPLHLYLDNWHSDAEVRIQQVELLIDGGGGTFKVVATDNGHVGVASRANTNGNIFVLVPPAGPIPEQRYAARFSLHADGEYAGEWVFGAHRKGRPGRVYCSLRQNRTLLPGSPHRASLVLGAFPPGQLRRAFLHYLERERPHRARQVLHYNSWYDLGTGQPYGAEAALAALELTRGELAARGARLDALLLDDGWDDPDAGPWAPHAGLAAGLGALGRRAAELRVGLGVWLSPWGGYHEPRQRRLAAARRAGLRVREEPGPRVPAALRAGGEGACTAARPCGVGEGDCASDADCAGDLACFQTQSGASPPGVDASAVADRTADFCFDPKVHAAFLGLGEPGYYAFFRGVVVRWLRAGASLLKLDGFGNPAGSAFTLAEDFDAMVSLLADLRRVSPDVFINLSTGTWPSPFWLMSADTIWRRGHDHYFHGDGPARERWSTYRDAMVYEHVVQEAPLFPLSSLMVHGIIFAKDAWDLNKLEGSGDGTSNTPFRHEVRSAFGSGTMLQELYLTPKLLNSENWDDIADAARWARTATNTLADVHWYGGNPAHGSVYGWAAWRDADEDGTLAHAVLTLRNPSAKGQTISLHAAEVFDLPGHAHHSLELCSPFDDQRPRHLHLHPGANVPLQLQPFDVLVFDSAVCRGDGRHGQPVELPIGLWVAGATALLAFGMPAAIRRWIGGTVRLAGQDGAAPASIEELRRRRLAALDHRASTANAGTTG